jgi:Fungalysin/Thermolysin Propeptide Motif
VALGCVIAAAPGGGAAAEPAAPTVAEALRSAAAPVAQLVPGRTIQFEGTTIVRYKQEVGGVPVLGGDVAVIGDGGTTAPAVAMDASAARVAQPPAPKVSATAAVAIATNATGASGLRAKPTARLAIDPKRGDALVRRVTLASSRPLRDFQVLVDATTGEVLQKINVLHYASTQTGKAQLYTPNPIAMNGGYGGIGIGKAADHGDGNTPKLTALRAPVNLKLIKKGQHCLVGKFVQARVGGGRGAPVCRRSLDWRNVTRANEKFEALEAYQQITHLQRYYHRLGFTGKANVHPRRQKVIANAFAQDNSFYSPGDRTIRFGRGGVDDGEDGDVITHEYGHSIQDAQDPGFGNCDCPQSGALGEGFGDFESAVNTAISFRVPHSFLHDAEYCIFDWDGTGGYGGPGVKPCGRLATGSDGTGRPTKTYSQALHTCHTPQGPEVHCLGEVWSHGLIDLLNSLQPDSRNRPPIVVDVLLSQFIYRDNETFNQAVNALLDADDAVYGNGHVGSGPHDAAICAEMKTARGINTLRCP